MKIGSLFDGSGGFPLAASMCGMKPVWASEVEPYPIAVTRSRFPDMTHLGDVSKIHGSKIEPVDVITFGSPCQDMSIAGKRAGIKNENAGDDETTRSGLFWEAARIIKEMREATNGVYPRFAVWENVPGAFSSNKGEDFRLVLKTLVQIVEPSADVPPVPKSGWSYYDCWMGDGWSLAYRTFDAQYWGVPQRRRRIYLVLDLTGQRAGEILFKREGVRGYFTESGETREGTAADAERGSGVCDRAAQFVGAIRLDNTSANPYGGDETAPTIATGTGHGGAANIGVCVKNCLTPWDYQSKRVYGVDGVFPSLQSGERSGQNQQTIMVPVYCLQGNTIDRNAQQNGCGICEDVAFTLNAVDRHGIVAAGFKAGQGAQARSIGWEEERVPTLAADAGGNSVPSVCMRMRGFGDYEQDETASALKARDFKDCTDLIVQKMDIKNIDLCFDLSVRPIVFDKEVYNSGENATGGHYIAEGGPAPTLRTDGHPPGVCIRYIVRRLTPTECDRLQGFPDRWGDIEPMDISDELEIERWRYIYKTYCVINGLKISPSILSKPERLKKWHDKLHTDSAEYKMWGNGIALPNALYVMQGIEEALKHG